MKVRFAALSFVLASALPLGSALLAQDQQATPPAKSATAQSHTSGPASVNTLAGKIERKDGRYVLLESASKAPYVLDDQKEAKRYAGRVVFVTGTVDMAAKTIHVQKIEVAA